jgi:hypothetical protein
MPYVRRGLCVFKKDSGKKVGCSDTIEGAKGYLRKLEMVSHGEHKRKLTMKGDK